MINIGNGITALYVRVSTKFQAEEGYSITAQLEKLHYFCKSKGWENVKEYVDGGYSGSNLERPFIKELISDANNGKIKRVVVVKLDRLSRSQKDTLYLIEDVFLKNNVEFISLNESLDTSTPFGKAMIGILSVFAQLERENIYLRTRIGMKERAKLGYWRGGGTTPFGYDYDINQGILVPNENAEIVKQIYRLYLDGMSPQKIADMFDLKYDKLIIGILTRKVYHGIIQYKGEEYQGLHEPIITEEMYNQVQIDMERRSKRARAIQRHDHLLTGLIYCGVCGARMRYMKWGGDRWKIACYTKAKDKRYMSKMKDCDSDYVWADDVEKIIIDDLFNISIKLQNNKMEQSVIDPLERIKKEIENKKEQIKRVMILYTEQSDTIPEDIFNSFVEELNYDINKLENKYNEESKTRISKKNIDSIIDKVVSIGDIWDDLDEKGKQKIIRECVEKIVIDKGKISIFYTFQTNNSVI